MFKKLVAIAAVFLTVGVISSPSHASGTVQLISPQNKTITTNNVILVSGKGRQGTSLNIDAYLAHLLRNNVDLNNIPKGGYILIVSEDLTIGASGSFAKELKLRKGLNKVEVKVKTGNSSNLAAVRYIYVTDLNTARRELRSVNDARFANTLNRIK